MEAIAREVIQQAQKHRIDDIHLLPNKDNYSFFLRDSSGLRAFKSISHQEAERFISYMKYQANMDVGERRRPQSGAFTFRVNQKYELELRLSVITNYKLQESLVIRLLHMTGQEEVATMTYFPSDMEYLARLLRYKSGLLLFSGPISSGKTSTIYQLLRQEMALEAKQIITMEDPVEISEPLFLQTEINEKANISYDVLIKSCLRHHPDVMLVGEIRDEETAKMVIRGALTGHLMIASVHAKDCLGVLSRMMELGVSKQLLSQTLIAVSSQRLIARYCDLCQGDCHLYCNHIDRSQKKGTLFDILQGQELYQKLEETHQDHWQENSFNRKLRKAYGLGYISKSSYIKYQIF